MLIQTLGVTKAERLQVILVWLNWDCVVLCLELLDDLLLVVQLFLELQVGLACLLQLKL